MTKIYISTSDDHAEWETFGLNCAKVAGIDINSVVVTKEGQFFMIFDRKVAPSDGQFNLMEGLLKNTAVHAKCKIPAGWRFESIGLDKSNYLNLVSNHVVFAVAYKRR